MPEGDWLYDLSANRYKKTYMNGFLDISGNLTIRNGSLYLNNGDISHNGNLVLYGDASINSNLIVTSNLTAKGNIKVGQDASSQTNITVQGNLTSNTLNISKDASFNSKLYVGGDMSLNGTLCVVGDASFNSKLYVAGDASFNSKLYVAGNTLISKILNVTGDVSFNSKLVVQGNVHINSKLTIGGYAFFNSRLIVASDVSINSNLIAKGNANFNSNLFIGNSLTVKGNSLITGNVGVGTTTPAVSLDISATDALRIPTGTTGQRPTANTEAIHGGYMRYNTTTNKYEGFGTEWRNLGGVSNAAQNAKINATSTEFEFYTAPLGSVNAADAIESMRIKTTGDASINYRLSVGGNASVGGILNIANHNGSTTGLKLNGTLVRATAAQINRLVVTPGSASASKAVVLDANKSISGINDLTLTGNLTAGNLFINGTTTSINSNALNITDNIIGLANGTVTNGDAGFIITRSAGNKFFGWNQASSKFIFGNTTGTGTSTSITVTPDILKANLDGSLNIALDSTNAYRYLYFTNNTTGYGSIYANSNLKFNPSTGDLSAATFVGALTGTSQVSSAITIATSNSATALPLALSTIASGNASIVKNTGVTYTPSTGTITSGLFNGNIIHAAPNITSMSTLSTVGNITTGTWSATGISAEYIVDGSVTSAKFATGSITAAKIANAAINSTNIVVGTIDSAKLATNIISNINIASDISNNKLASSAFTIGTTIINLGDTTYDISGLTSIATTDLSGKIFGNLDGTIYTQTQSAISSMPGVTSFGTTDISTSITGNITFTQDLSLNGQFTQTGTPVNTIAGAVTFSNKPTCTDPSTNNVNEFITVGDVNNTTFTGGSAPADTTFIVTTNTAQDISGTKIFATTPYQEIDVGYNDNSYNAVNGYFALSKDTAQKYADGLSFNAANIRNDNQTILPSVSLTSIGYGSWFPIAYSPSLNVYVAGYSSYPPNISMAYSSNGINWTYSTSLYLLSGTVSSATSSPSTTSTFGISEIVWVPAHANITSRTSYWGLNISNGYFIAVSYDGSSRSIISIDGINWYMRTTGGPSQVYNITYISEINVLLTGRRQPSSTVYTSNTNDPLVWSTSPYGSNAQIVLEGTTTQLTTKWWEASTYSYINNQVTVVLTHTQGNDSNNYSAVSTNVSSTNAGSFIAYRKFYTSRNPLTLYTGYGNWQGLAWSSSLNLFVAVGGFGRHVARSSDGITWDVSLDVLPISPSNNNSTTRVNWIADKSMFITTPSSFATPTMSTSLDGVNWTSYDLTSAGLSRSAGSSPLPASTNYRQSKLLYVASLSKIFFITQDSLIYSIYADISNNNLINFTITPNAITAYNYPVSFSDAIVTYSAYLGVTSVVSGRGGSVLYSYDTIKWKPGGVYNSDGTVNGSGYIWKRFLWVPTSNMFIIMNNPSTIAYSYDGITWTIHATGIAFGSGAGLMWSNELSKIFAFTSTNTLATSTNGLTWTSATFNYALNIEGTVYTSVHRVIDAAYSPELQLFTALVVVFRTAAPSYAISGQYSSDGINWTGKFIYIYDNSGNRTTVPAVDGYNAGGGLQSFPDYLYWTSELKKFIAIAVRFIISSQNGKDWYGLPLIYQTINRTLKPLNAYSRSYSCYANEIGLFLATAYNTNNSITSRMPDLAYDSYNWSYLNAINVGASEPFTGWCNHPGVGVSLGTGTYVISTSPPANLGIRLQQNTTNYWTLLPYNNSTTRLLDFVYKDNTGSTIPAYISTTVTTSTINFTGQHRCFVNNVPYSMAGQLYGLIVSANTNNYISMLPSPTYGLNAITINESLPIVSISQKDNDKACFGVISSGEDPDVRQDKYGRFHSILPKEVGDTRVYINSVGEGAIWVTNKNGALLSGDLITTSTVTGYGQKQTSNYFTNYTVAKITMDCNFQPAVQFVQQIKKSGSVSYTYTPIHNYPTDPIPFLSVSDLIGGFTLPIADGSYNLLSDNWKQYFIRAPNVDDNDSDSKLWAFIPRVETPIVINEAEYNALDDNERPKYVLTSNVRNVLDQYNQIQFEDTSETEYSYNIRYLKPDGSIITKETYESIISNGNNAYIAAFVSCTYHCG